MDSMVSNTGGEEGSDGTGSGPANTYYERMPWRWQTNDGTFMWVCLKIA